MLSDSPPNVGRFPKFVIDGHSREELRSCVRVMYTPCLGNTSADVCKFSVGTVCLDPIPCPLTIRPSNA